MPISITKNNSVDASRGTVLSKVDELSIIGTIYPTPPLGQDMTQGQFLSGV